MPNRQTAYSCMQGTTRSKLSQNFCTVTHTATRLADSTHATQLVHQGGRQRGRHSARGQAKGGMHNVEGLHNVNVTTTYWQCQATITCLYTGRHAEHTRVELQLSGGKHMCLGTCRTAKHNLLNSTHCESQATSTRLDTARHHE